MQITRVVLQNFKNLNGEYLLDPGINLIIGDNGLGKTNFLEALGYITKGASFRNLDDRDLLNWRLKSQFAKISASVLDVTENLLNEYSCIIADDIGILRKKFQIDGVKAKKLNFIYKVPTFVFQPHDILLLNGSPDLRRRELDDFLKILNSEYAQAENKYKKVLQNRNSLLKDIRENSASTDELGYWDNEIVNLGSYIIWARVETLRHFMPIVKEFAQDIFEENFDDLEVRYISKLTDENSDLEAIRERFMAKILNGRYKEIASGQSLYGPQRDDIQFVNEEVDMHKYGSRGQQRLVALIFKLAMWQYYFKKYGKKPVLLLDDMMSELDISHRRKLEKALQKIKTQIVFSSTNEDDFSDELLSSSRRIEI